MAQVQEKMREDKMETITLKNSVIKRDRMIAHWGLGARRELIFCVVFFNKGENIPYFLVYKIQAEDEENNFYRLSPK